MAVAALLNWIPVLLVMVPRWFNIAMTIEPLNADLLGLAPVFHGVLGAAAQLLMTYTVVRMFWLNQLPPNRPLWLMRITLVVWLLTLTGGVVVYTTRYII
jgi:hypothetical protein